MSTSAQIGVTGLAVMGRNLARNFARSRSGHTELRAASRGLAGPGATPLGEAAGRDFFGAHTYRRTDREGSFHTLWGGDRPEAEA